MQTDELYLSAACVSRSSGPPVLQHRLAVNLVEKTTQLSFREIKQEVEGKKVFSILLSLEPSLISVCLMNILVRSVRKIFWHS